MPSEKVLYKLYKLLLFTGLEIAACQWPNGRPNVRFGRGKYM